MPARSGNYTIASGNTFFTIAKMFDVDIATIQNLNPGVMPEALQVGQVINVPNSTGNTVPLPTTNPPPAVEIYMIKSGDTFDAIAQRIGVRIDSIQALNPGVKPESLQVGQEIKVPNKPAAISHHHHHQQHQQNIPGYDSFSGPASNFPHPQSWASYEHLIRSNERLMLLSSSPSEVASIKKWIPIIASESGVDPRVILSIIMQESGGNVRVATTYSPAPDFIKNTGLMQAHNGQEWDPRNPDRCIERMIRDGAQGTVHGDGLIQCFNRWDRNWYHACRAYNSGRVNTDDLSDGITATGHYVERVANRLCGNTWKGM